MIRIGVKGRITKGLYSPKGELIVEKAADDNFGDYYIYVWPNDGNKWPETDKDMVYDTWLEDWDWVESYFKHRHWEVEWYDEEENKKK